jgi:hypothetical protein
MKIIRIVGSRRRKYESDFHKVKNAFWNVYEHGDEIVSGGCPEGGDRFAEIIAKESQVPIKIYYAQWGKLGKSAGFQRNGLIVKDADVLIACVAEDRKGGTEDTIKKFEKLNKGKVYLV